MLKRKPLLFSALIFATLALFAAPAVMAEWPEPPSIYENLPMTAMISVPKSGTYNITADVYNGETCEGGVSCDKYVLSFSHSTGNLSGLNAIYLTTPQWYVQGDVGDSAKYCDESLKIIQISSDWQRNQSTEVLHGLSGRAAMQWTAMTGGQWWIGLNKVEVEDLVPGTICVKDGRYFGCAAIAVFDCPRPDCEPPPVIGPSVGTETQCLNVGTGGEVLSASFSVITSGIGAGFVDHTSVKWYYSTDCSGDGSVGTTAPLGHPDDYCLSGPGQKPECWNKESHSPGQYTVCNPLGCTTYRW